MWGLVWLAARGCFDSTLCCAVTCLPFVSCCLRVAGVFWVWLVALVFRSLACIDLVVCGGYAVVGGAFGFDCLCLLR